MSNVYYCVAHGNYSPLTSDSGCPRCRMNNVYYAPLLTQDHCQHKIAAIEEKLRVAVEALEMAEAEIAVYSVTAYGQYRHDLPSLVQIRQALAKIKGGIQ